MGEDQEKDLLTEIDIRYITAARRYSQVLPKIPWLLLGLGMLGFTTYCLYEMLFDYVHYPSFNLVTTEFAGEYHFPAITICNTNKLNRSSMEADRVKGMSTYDRYKTLLEVNADRKASSDVKESKGQSVMKLMQNLDSMDIYRRFRWDILSTMDQFTFAAARLDWGDKDEYIKVQDTEMGSCLQINDKRTLVQRVNGPRGGLSLVLDTQLENYLDETQNEGFYVVIRMPGERVLNREYAFMVSPGKEHYISLDTVQVERLQAPWGTCRDMADVFATSESRGKMAQEILTVKECYSSQVLHQYMNNPECRCYPWYIYSRLIKNTTHPDKRNAGVEEKLRRYWTEELPAEERISFDSSTCHFEDRFGYEGEPLETLVDDAKTSGECAARCEKLEGCVLFQLWTRRTGQLREVVCELYSGSGTELTEDVENLVKRGMTNCTGVLDECPIVKESQCENRLMDQQMGESEEEEEEGDLTGTKKTTHTCYEPCTYNKTEYSISSSSFPSERYWKNSLKAKFPHYNQYSVAQRNLVKLVFFQDLLMTRSEAQTASYDWWNFIGELGGLVDLCIGISFFTVFKFFEWTICRLWACLAVGRN